jgi:hypothetical protein
MTCRIAADFKGFEKYSFDDLRTMFQKRNKSPSMDN